MVKQNNFEWYKALVKDRIHYAEKLQIEIKYDNDIIITDSILNDLYNEIFNINRYDENTIINTVNSIDNVRAFYDYKIGYFYVRIIDAVNHDATYCLESIIENLQEKYKQVAKSMLVMLKKSYDKV